MADLHLVILIHNPLHETFDVNTVYQNFLRFSIFPLKKRDLKTSFPQKRSAGIRDRKLILTPVPASPPCNYGNEKCLSRQFLFNKKGG
jgi:hypothetical protein